MNHLGHHRSMGESIRIPLVAPELILRINPCCDNSCKRGFRWGIIRFPSCFIIATKHTKLKCYHNNIPRFQASTSIRWSVQTAMQLNTFQVQRAVSGGIWLRKVEIGIQKINGWQVFFGCVFSLPDSNRDQESKPKNLNSPHSLNFIYSILYK